MNAYHECMASIADVAATYVIQSGRYNTLNEYKYWVALWFKYHSVAQASAQIDLPLAT